MSCDTCSISTNKLKSKKDVVKDNTFEEIINSMSFMSSQFDYFNTKIDSVLDEIKTLKAMHFKTKDLIMKWTH